MIQVAADNPYQVHVSHGARRQVANYLGDANRVAIFHTASVENYALEVAKSLDVDTYSIEVNDGEHAKNVKTLDQCWQTLASHGLTRNDVVIGVGGGALTDLAGFVAATYLRGVGYISVPTTVLSMVDAAVGGKTGIDLPQGKNLVGAFYEPRTVVADLDFLASLPGREVTSGLAEVVKAGFVRDSKILDLIEEDPQDAKKVGSDRLKELITRGISFKAEVVSADLRERTSSKGNIGRELLNYGHTMGHAIERFENFKMRHGEAVALGMVFAAELSHRIAGLSAEDLKIHRELIGALGLETAYSAAPYDELRLLMSLDKKSRGKTLRFIGLESLGTPTLIENPDEEILRQCYESLRG